MPGKGTKITGVGPSIHQTTNGKLAVLGCAHHRELVYPLVGHLRFQSLLASFVVLLLTYTLVPNTHVRLRPAAWGALVAAVLWSLSRWGFGLYVSEFLPYMKIYGALGLIPLFLSC